MAAFVRINFISKYVWWSVLFVAFVSCEKNEELSEKSNKKKANQNYAAFAPATVKVSNDIVTATISIHGSAITEFRFINDTINPLNWHLAPSELPLNHKGAPPFAGHFLCIGRWGAPSESEIAAGLMHNGDVNTGFWKLLFQKYTSDSTQHTRLYFHSKKEQIQLIRDFYLSPGSNAIYVSETVFNLNYNDRLFNWVQHPTIGAPFLTPNTLIDCNAGYGFDQRQSPDLLNKTAFKWPDGKLIDGPVNLRTVNDDRGYVTTHVFDNSVKTGWVTATTAEKKLTIGYIFNVEEYPWLNLWHWKKDGKPHAHGLEFGTTGYGKPYPELLDKCVEFKGRKSYIILPAKGMLKKSYLMFLARVPTDCKGIRHISHRDAHVHLVLDNISKLDTLTFLAPYSFDN